MCETCQTSVCSVQLSYIMRIMDVLMKLRMAEALYTAVQWVDEAIEIYDNRQRVQVSSKNIYAPMR